MAVLAYCKGFTWMDLILTTSLYYYYLHFRGEEAKAQQIATQLTKRLRQDCKPGWLQSLHL